MESPTPGQRLGRYELLHRLGRGAMGEVWEALLHGPQGFQKSVALKVLRSGPADEISRLGLVQEARLGALLQHPNVVGTYELGEADGRWFVAMELVRGASLGQLVAAGPLPGHLVPEIGVQICAGLAHIHGARIAGQPAGLLHRDIKPSNLLLDTLGYVKVADLGISGFAGPSGEISGTPGFMPPEQAAGRPQDARSDLFSVGASLFVFATGRRPFGSRDDAANPVRRVEALLDRGLLDEADAAVPGLGAVLRKCFRHDPAERWASASELGDALAALRSRQVRGASLVDVLLAARPDLSGVARDWSGQTSPVASVPSTVVIERGNLRAPRDRFVGREAEVAELVRRVRTGPRLLTLLGLGGAGKTRLALEVARAVQHQLPGGAWFFDLSEARNADGLCFAVAQALSLQLAAGDPVTQVGRALGARGEALLVLDNLEQVVAEAPVIGRWAELAPDARLLCTSRVALRLRGEERVAVGPMAVDDGVVLFQARAERSAPAEEVRPLVVAVDGSPLAIELLAARSRILSCGELLRRLGPRLISGTDRDRPDRHRSLTAALDGSVELLTAPAASALGQLSVFEGGFELEAAEAVVAFDGVWAVDALEELVDASLLRVDERGRFGMPVLVQQYAAERLTGAARQDAESRHGVFYAQQGSAAALAAMYTAGGVERWHQLSVEADNLLAACRRAVERGDGEVASGAALAAAAILVVRGPIAAAVAVLRQVVEIAPAARRLQIQAHLGDTLHDLGALDEGIGILERALERARRQRDRRMEGELLTRLGSSYRAQGRTDEACLYLEAGLAIHRELGDRRWEGNALGGLGWVHRRKGRNDEARSWFESALTVMRDLGARRLEGGIFAGLGGLAMQIGRMDEARDHFDAALTIFREVGGRRDEARVLGTLGTVHLFLGRMAESRAHYRAALELHREVDSRWAEAGVLNNLGLLHQHLGRLAEARSHFQDALAVAEELGARPLVGIAHVNLGSVALDQGRTDEARGELERALEVFREIGDRANEGFALGRIGVLLRELGQIDDARTHLESALAIFREVEDRRWEGIGLGDLGTLERTLGNPAVARERYREALAVLAGIGDRRSEGVVEAELGALCLEQGDLPGAGQHLERAIVGSREQDDRRSLGAALGTLGELRRRERDLGASGVALAEGEHLLREVGDAISLAVLLQLRARRELDTGDSSAARATLAEVEQLVQAVGVGPESRLARELAASKAAVARGQ